MIVNQWKVISSGELRVKPSDSLRGGTERGGVGAFAALKLRTERGEKKKIFGKKRKKKKKGGKKEKKNRGGREMRPKNGVKNHPNKRINQT